ncbi:DUF1837 domain-containing protein [Listeria innocua]|nr:DUF1837 domain-containing protein [Listeria innocua]
MEVRKILKCQISKTNLSSYFIDFDLDSEGNLSQRLDDFVHLLAQEIPNFALGFHQGDAVPQDILLDTLIDAANSIYKIDCYKKTADIYGAGGFLDDDVSDKYLRRGEFGELILHLLLKYYFETFPLIAKIYFKDSYGHAVHGFDSIHIQPKTNTLWLGESKLYTDGKKGVDALVEDLYEHFNIDYFRSEFNIISKRLNDSKDIIDNYGHDTEYWISLLNQYTSVSEKLDNIVIPLFCAYETDFFDDFDSDSDTFETRYLEEINTLHERFSSKSDNHNWISKMNIIVILMPLKSKKKLVSMLHQKLKIIQSLGVGRNC